MQHSYQFDHMLSASTAQLKQHAANQIEKIIGFVIRFFSTVAFKNEMCSVQNYAEVLIGRSADWIADCKCWRVQSRSERERYKMTHDKIHKIRMQKL